MTPKRRRHSFVLSGLLALGVAAALILSSLEENLVFFHSPTDLQTKTVGAQDRIRIGGLVEEGSVQRGADSLDITFRVADLRNTISVHYRGLLPDLFREGQGIVAEGRLQENGMFEASEILAKHDENYMPPAVTDALKKSGHWKDGQQKEETPE